MEKNTNLHIEEMESMDAPGWTEVGIAFGTGVAIGGAIVAFT
ncbi:daptide-type RiPP [Saccharibacillus kuerlensis]|uniref:Class IIb bacteriocin, lactobin A/cerein 7B family n=1 Tax=Saccharibacillus kuerlensis TaxID=459527 RepID=A0ABQ2L210_9BACL|nr:daptide-type RiPP [Saccharibacillus kuerlensis]GGO00018.1 hypothetical protein GCM10010969_20760 [Saccharibacillus kuerlensis]